MIESFGLDVFRKMKTFLDLLCFNTGTVSAGQITCESKSLPDTPTNDITSPATTFFLSICTQFISIIETAKRYLTCAVTAALHFQPSSHSKSHNFTQPDSPDTSCSSQKTGKCDQTNSLPLRVASKIPSKSEKMNFENFEGNNTKSHGRDSKANVHSCARDQTTNFSSPMSTEVAAFCRTSLLPHENEPPENVKQLPSKAKKAFEAVSWRNYPDSFVTLSKLERLLRDLKIGDGNVCGTWRGGVASVANRISKKVTKCRNRSCKNEKRASIRQKDRYRSRTLRDALLTSERRKEHEREGHTPTISPRCLKLKRSCVDMDPQRPIKKSRLSPCAPSSASCSQQYQTDQSQNADVEMTDVHHIFECRSAALLPLGPSQRVCETLGKRERADTIGHEESRAPLKKKRRVAGERLPVKM